MKTVKNAKKIAVLLLVVVSLAAVTLLFTACNKDVGNEYEKTVTIVIGEGENKLVYDNYTTTARYLFDALNELSNRETDPLKMGGSWGQFGMFLTEIGDLKAESNSYICVLATDTEYQDITDYAVKKTYNGTELTSATLGVSSLPLKDGQTYLFCLVAF